MASEQIIVAVPTPTPVTMPAVVTVAIAASILAHTIPGVGQVKVVDCPIQIAELPEIGKGDGLTVMTLVTLQPVPSE